CLTSDSSSGVRDFIARHYPRVKQTNPDLPVLVREATGIEPKVWARFEYGRESNASLAGLNGDQVLQQIQDILKSDKS
ncbi:unnamed protein product, partial [Oppiella nova]